MAPGVSEVQFHFNVPHAQHYACRLLRKLSSQARRAVVLAPAERLHALDQALWALSDVDFVPHCHAGADAALLRYSPLVLCEALADAPHHDVLLNLSGALAPGAGRFARVLEVVEVHAAEREAARLRLKQYRAHGFAVSSFNVQTREHRQH